MSVLGERLTSTTRCLHTPTASEWEDGDAIDAGTAMILSHNLAHLQAESLRWLGGGPGPGACVNNRGWTTRVLADTQDTADYVETGVIAWNQETSRILGPYALIADRERAGDRTTWREIKVVVDANAGSGSSLVLYVCATLAGHRPSRETRLVITSLTASNGRARNVLTVSLTADLAPGTFACRGGGGESVGVVLVDLHVGWSSTNAADAIVALSAFEVR